MPQLGQTGIGGKQVGMLLPQWGMQSSLIMTDPIHGNKVYSGSHVGVLTPVVGDEKFVLATAEVPVYFEPDNFDSRWADVASEFKTWIQDNFNEVAASSGSLDGYFQSRKKEKYLDDVQILSNPRDVYMISRGVTFSRKVSRLVNELRRVGFPGYVTARAVGSGIWAKSGMERPGQTIEFGEFEMEGFLPTPPLPLNIRRSYCHYQMLAAVAFRHLAEKWRFSGDPGLHYDEADWMAYAACLGSQYGGDNRSSIDTTAVVDVETRLPTLYQYLGQPFSMGWPFLTLDPDFMNSEPGARLMEAIFGANVALYLLATEVGGYKAPYEYHNVGKGSQWVVEQAVKYYVKGPMDIGGTSTIWLQPPTNQHLFTKGTLVPCALRPGGKNRYGSMSPETNPYSDITIDRGEVPLETTTLTTQQFMRVIVSRDSRLGIRREKFENWIVLKIPVTSWEKNRAFAADLMLAYMAGATGKSKYITLSEAGVLLADVGFIAGNDKQPIPGELQLGAAKDLGASNPPPEREKGKGPDQSPEQKAAPTGATNNSGNPMIPPPT